MGDFQTVSHTQPLMNIPTEHNYYQAATGIRFGTVTAPTSTNERYKGLFPRVIPRERDDPLQHEAYWLLHCWNITQPPPLFQNRQMIDFADGELVYEIFGPRGEAHKAVKRYEFLSTFNIYGKTFISITSNRLLNEFRKEPERNFVVLVPWSTFRMSCSFGLARSY